VVGEPTQYILFFVCRTDDGVDVELYDLPPGTFIQSAIAPAAIEVGYVVGSNH
jgi:hypothetical protein